MKYRAPNPNRSGGRSCAEALARGLAGCVVSPYWPLGPWTSAERRWSQIMGVRMRRTSPHPRPWDGPIISFEGIFRDVDRQRLTGAWIE